MYISIERREGNAKQGRSRRKTSEQSHVKVREKHQIDESRTQKSAKEQVELLAP